MEKKKYVTVQFNGRGLDLHLEIAERFNLSEDDVIRSTERFWEVLSANAQYGLEQVQLLIEIEERLKSEESSN